MRTEAILDNQAFEQKSYEVLKRLDDLRRAEVNTVIPFMNGDFTQWDLYLALSSEYVVRLIDGFIPLVESRNLVCVAQLLRAQIGVCLRTFALFVTENQDAFLDHAFKDGRIDKLKDRFGKRMTDARLQSLLEPFDEHIKEVYDTTSGFVHFSTSILPSMAAPLDGFKVNFNFGADPNERNNMPLIECSNAFCHYVDLHLQMLNKVIRSDDWYADRMEIHQDAS